MAKKLLPQDRDAEAVLLGGLLTAGDYRIAEAMDIVAPADFMVRDHAFIYKAILNLFNRNDQIDSLAVVSEMKRLGADKDFGYGEDRGELYLIGLMAKAPIGVAIGAHAKTIAEKARRRRMIAAAQQMAQLGYDETGDLTEQIEKAEMLVLGIRPELSSGTRSDPDDYVTEFLDKLDEQRKQGVTQLGIPTGLSDMDLALGGLLPKQMYIIAGRPGMGKSSLCVNIAAYSALKDKKRVLIFSLEMDTDQLTRRIVASMTKIDSKKIRQPGNLTQQQMADIYNAGGQLANSELYIEYVPGIKPASLRAKARRKMMEKGPLDLIIVDYLQLMNPDRNRNNPVYEVGDISKSLAALAGELGVPLVAASQLSRSVEHRQDKRPQLSDLRDSGSLEQDAFAVMFIYREEYYNKQMSAMKGMAEIDLAKHREGPLAQFYLRWRAEITEFSDYHGGQGGANQGATTVVGKKAPWPDL